MSPHHHTRSPYQPLPSANSPASSGPLVALIAGCCPGTAVAIAPGAGSTTLVSAAVVVACAAVFGAFVTRSNGPMVVLPVSGSTAAARLFVGKGAVVDLPAVLVGSALFPSLWPWSGSAVVLESLGSLLSGSAVVLENLGSDGSLGRGSNVAFWWDGGGRVSPAASLAAWGAWAGVGGGGRSSERFVEVSAGMC